MASNNEEEIILGILFLKFINFDINHSESIFKWRTYDAKVALETTQWMELVESKMWAKDMLKGANIFLMHVKLIDNLSPILSISERDNTSPMFFISKISPKYADFADMFSNINVYIFSEHGNYNHAIDLIDETKQLLYGPIYNFSELKLAVLQAHIDLHLKIKFIKPFKLPAKTFILFVKKPNSGL